MKPDLRECLEQVLHRPVTDSELSRAWSLGQAAMELLREAQGPVPGGVQPSPSRSLALVPVIARVLEGGPLEIRDDDLRRLARYAADARGPHPFTLA